MLGLIVPIWIALRIGALYHIDVGATLRPFAFCWAAGAAILLPAMRGGTLQANHLLSVLSYASLAAMIFVYYQPVLKKGEDGPMGEGKLQIDGTDVNVQFRPLWSRKAASGTEYSLLMIPLGGFAAISGMAPKQDGSETKIDGGFYAKGPLRRLATLFAGPLFSVLFGILVLVGLFATVGETKPDLAPVIGQVGDSTTPAGKAGLKSGDVIVSVNGERVSSFYRVLCIVRDRPLQRMEFAYSRNGKVTETAITPDRTVEPADVLGRDLEPTGTKKIMGKLGISPKMRVVRLGLVDAVREAVKLPGQMIEGLLAIAQRPAMAKDELAGPGTIAVAAVDATSEGFSTVLLLAGVLSISLGVMNLLPIPPMDGGQMVVAFVELLRGGRRLSLQVQQMIASGGMLLVMMLAFGVLALDANRFFGPKEKLTTDKPLPQARTR
jgi:regulator of sigma E protease